MKDEDNLKLIIPKLFYPAFKKAVQDCIAKGKNMILMKKEIPGEHTVIVEVNSDEPEDFFYLGSAYANRKMEL